MKTGVLLLWTACLAALALSLLRLIFWATAGEKLLLLLLALAAAGSLHRPDPSRKTGPRKGKT